jgi:hypothetical protein
MITETKKHRALVAGVSVTLSASGGFVVTATAAAVKRWPWDGTSWPCANLHRAHRFTFEANGDLCDLETSQADSRDGENGRAVGGLADDCRALGLEVLTRLETPPPDKVSAIRKRCAEYLGNRGICEPVKRAAYFQGLWFIVFDECHQEVEVSIASGVYECYDIKPAKGFAWNVGNFKAIKAEIEKWEARK